MKKSAKTVPEAGVSADDDTGGVARHTPNNNMLADQVRLDDFQEPTTHETTLIQRYVIIIEKFLRRCRLVHL